MPAAPQSRMSGHQSQPTAPRYTNGSSSRADRRSESPQEEQPPADEDGTAEPEGPTPSKSMEAILNALEESPNKQR